MHAPACSSPILRGQTSPVCPHSTPPFSLWHFWYNTLGPSAAAVPSVQFCPPSTSEISPLHGLPTATRDPTAAMVASSLPHSKPHHAPDLHQVTTRIGLPSERPPKASQSQITAQPPAPALPPPARAAAGALQPRPVVTMLLHSCVLEATTAFHTDLALCC